MRHSIVKIQTGHHQKSPSQTNECWCGILSFISVARIWGSLLLTNNFSSFVSHWDNFGTEKLCRYTWEAQKRQGDIQVCLTQLCGNAVLTLLQLQFEAEPAVSLLRQNPKAAMAFQLSVCLRPCTAACQARSPLEYAHSAAQRAWPRTPQTTHPRFELSSWGTSSYQSHWNAEFPNLFLSGMTDECCAASVQVTISQCMVSLRDLAPGAFFPFWRLRGRWKEVGHPGISTTSRRFGALRSWFSFHLVLLGRARVFYLGNAVIIKALWKASIWYWIKSK